MLPEFPLHLFNPPPTAKGGYSPSYEDSMKWLTGTGSTKSFGIFVQGHLPPQRNRSSCTASNISDLLGKRLTRGLTARKAQL